MERIAVSEVSKVTVRTEQEVSIAPKLQRQLKTELEGYEACSIEIKALDATKKDHGAEVLRLSEQIDGDKFAVEGYKVAVKRNQKKRSLNRDKLVKRLVKDGKYTVKAALAVLEDCTDETPVKDHVRITIPGQRDEEE